MFLTKNFRKLFAIFFIIILLPSSCSADDYIEPIESTSDFSTIVTSSSPSDLPNTNSRSCIVLERSTGAILFGKNEFEVRKMASTTKIMTALIVLENEDDLSKIVTVSKKAAGIGGSRLGLSTDCKITVKDLLYGLMLCSGNDAAVALAEYIGGSVEGFANLMNQKALSLNLNNTHFVTPHGLDNDEHYTTVYELALLTNYALNNESFCKIVKTSNYTVNINGTPKIIHNTNELLGYLNGVYGVKTGFTNGANRCLVTACKRGDLDIICVVLGADTKKFRTQDSIKLIEYAFSNFKMVNIKNIISDEFENWKNNNLDNFIISKSVNSSVNVYLSDLPYEYYPINSNSDKIITNIKANFRFNAPFYKDTKIGRLEVFINSKNIFNLDILNLNTIEKRTLIDYFNIFFRNYPYYLESII